MHAVFVQIGYKTIHKSTRIGELAYALKVFFFLLPLRKKEREKE